VAANGCDYERFAVLEERAQRGMFRDYRDTGEALRQIRDEEQACWKADYGTWERYIRERWGISRQHANYFIQAAVVAADLSSRDDDPPLPLRHAALLYRFDDPDQRRSVAATIAPMSFAASTRYVTELVVGPVERTRRKVKKEASGQLHTLATAIRIVDSLDVEMTAAAIGQLDVRRRKQLLRRIEHAGAKLNSVAARARRLAPT
jgi:hypothetical protein